MVGKHQTCIGQSRSHNHGVEHHDPRVDAEAHLVNCPARWSLLLIFGFLYWSQITTWSPRRCWGSPGRPWTGWQAPPWHLMLAFWLLRPSLSLILPSVQSFLTPTDDQNVYFYLSSIEVSVPWPVWWYRNTLVSTFKISCCPKVRVKQKLVWCML